MIVVFEKDKVRLKNMKVIFKNEVKTATITALAECKLSGIEYIERQN